VALVVPRAFAYTRFRQADVRKAEGKA
jgi:hypothetical protein